MMGFVEMPMSCDVKWFEMGDLKKRSLKRVSWIPLCANDDSATNGRYGYLGYKKIYFGAIAVLFPADESEKAIAIPWSDVLVMSGHKPCIENNVYSPAGTFRSFGNGLVGEYPVLQQFSDTGEVSIWHLTQDIILGLGLYREGDSWVRPEEDYLKVARIRCLSNGKPLRLEIRAEQLRDFLCAKGCGLLVAKYHSREIIIDSAPEFGWENGIATENTKDYQWEGQIIELHEGGQQYGMKTAVIHMGRTNTDFEDEVPIYGTPGEDEFEHRSWEIEHKGRKLFRLISTMTRNEWIPPADKSPRVRLDRIESKVEFIVDGSGRKLSGRNLDGHRGYIWFRSDAILTFLKKRRGFLRWCTEDTGVIGSSGHPGVHFGVNELGFINVLARDIYLLPEIYQKVWLAHNIPPDGKVSKELLMSQMEAKPADTKAPEVLLALAIDHLQKVTDQFLGRSLLKEHTEADNMLQNIQRFHERSMKGICFLCKELTRLIIERIDVALLKELDPDADKKLGSIKRVDSFLTSKGFNGRQVTAPLVGVYEMRLGDAHLLSKDMDEAMKLLGLEGIQDYQKMAKEIIRKVAISIGITGDLIIRAYKEKP